MASLRIFRILFMIFTIAVFAISVNAEVPNYINYQGRVTDDSGQPINGSKFVKFKIYGSSTGDDSLWSSDLQVVTISEGLFNYKLGSNVVLPDDLFIGNNPRYLGVTVGTDAEISPRTQLIAVPYAIHANIADSAKNASPSPDGDWSINGNDIYHESGKVGIWTNSPNAPLVVGDDLGPVPGRNVVIGDNDVGSYPGLIIGRSDQYQGWLSYNVDGDYMNWGTREGGNFYSNTIVTKSGKVGINNTAPSEPLSIGDDLGSVYGDMIQIAKTGTDRYSGLMFGEDADNRGILLWVNNENEIHLGGNYNGNDYGATIKIQEDHVQIGGSSYAIDPNTTLKVRRLAAGMGGTAIYGKLHGAGDQGTSYGGYFVASNGYINTGAYGEADGAGYVTNYGVYGTCGYSTGDYGVYSYGNFHSTGSNTKAGGGFRIDHPQDPENMYLQHSDVSSPEMKNIYDGTVITDNNGIATVELPSYFESLNENFRYQLTVIGDFAQAIVSQKINGNKFSIKTNKPNIEVCWQVTGIRKDAFAKSRSLEVESVKKPEKKGYYQNPELFGFGIEKSISYTRHQENRIKKEK